MIEVGISEFVGSFPKQLTEIKNSLRTNTFYTPTKPIYACIRLY